VLGIRRGPQVLNVRLRRRAGQDVPGHRGEPIAPSVGRYPHAVEIEPGSRSRPARRRQITVNSFHHRSSRRFAGQLPVVSARHGRSSSGEAPGSRVLGAVVPERYPIDARVFSGRAAGPVRGLRRRRRANREAEPEAEPRRPGRVEAEPRRPARVRPSAAPRRRRGGARQSSATGRRRYAAPRQCWAPCARGARPQRPASAATAADRFSQRDDQRAQGTRVLLGREVSPSRPRPYPNGVSRVELWVDGRHRSDDNPCRPSRC
jgi:hypothetical protein